MSREILLMRHAKSRHDEAGIDDFSRDLASRAETDVAGICKQLRDHALIPGRIYSSSARRARQTARLVCRHLPVSENQLCFKDELYGSRMETQLDVIRDIPENVCLPMIVGHNPELEQMLEYLCGTDLPRTGNDKLLTTASVAHVMLRTGTQDVSRNSATLLHLLRPTASGLRPVPFSR